MNRNGHEGRTVYEFALTLDLPSESLSPFLEATAELATLAARQTDTPAPGSWLRMAQQATSVIGLKTIELQKGAGAGRRRSGRGGVAW